MAIVVEGKILQVKTFNGKKSGKQFSELVLQQSDGDLFSVLVSGNGQKPGQAVRVRVQADIRKSLFAEVC